MMGARCEGEKGGGNGSRPDVSPLVAPCPYRLWSACLRTQPFGCSLYIIVTRLRLTANALAGRGDGRGKQQDRHPSSRCDHNFQYTVYCCRSVPRLFMGIHTRVQSPRRGIPHAGTEGRRHAAAHYKQCRNHLSVCVVNGEAQGIGVRRLMCPFRMWQ